MYSLWWFIQGCNLPEHADLIIQLEIKSKELIEKDRQISEKDRQIEEKDNLIEEKMKVRLNYRMIIMIDLVIDSDFWIYKIISILDIFHCFFLC